MSRPILLRSDQHPYHVTARCNNQDFFPIPLSETWKIMVHELWRAEKDFAIQVHAFVLMGNHFHLLCHTPKSNLDQAMHAFQRNSAVRILHRANKKNHLWGARYRWSLIANQGYYYQAYRYIYQNPVRAELTARVEEYPYSTLRARVPFALHDRLGIQMGGEPALLSWLNQGLAKEDEKLIKLGLRKNQFDVNKKKLRLFEKLIGPKGT